MTIITWDKIVILKFEVREKINLTRWGHCIPGVYHYLNYDEDFKYYEFSREGDDRTFGFKRCDLYEIINHTLSKM